MKVKDLLSRGMLSFHTIFFRLVMTFILVLLPLFALGYSVYNWGLTTVKYDIAASTQAQVDFYSHNLDSELQRVRLLQYDLFNDTSLNKLEVLNTSLSNYDRDFALNRLQERLVSIKSSSSYVEQVKVLVPVLGKSITNLIIEDMNDKDERLIQAYDASTARTSVSKVDGVIYLLASTEFNSGRTDGTLPHAFIAITLSESNLSQMLQDLQTYRNSSSFLFADNPRFSVYADSGRSTADTIKTYIQKNGYRYSHNGYDLLKVNKKTYFISFVRSKSLGFTIARYAPESQIFQKISFYQRLFVFYSITAFLVIVIFTISLYRYIHSPLTTLMRAFSKVGIGNIQFEIRHNRKDEFSHIFSRFNAMLSHLNSLFDQVYKQKILLRNSELKQLQTQINPHFLYNSFFVLHRWIKYDYKEEAVLFSQHLGQYFEFVTRSTTDEVPLSRELEHARTYTEIQSMRFARRIQVNFETMPDDVNGLLVPRLILQPIIENAFEHGLEDVTEDGQLTIRFQDSNDAIRILVEDNGHQLTDDGLASLIEELSGKKEDDEVTGLFNIHRRLKLKFDEHGGIALERSDIGGLRVILIIPKGVHAIVKPVNRG